MIKNMDFEKPVAPEESVEPTISPEEALEIQKNKVFARNWSIMNGLAKRHFSGQGSDEDYQISATEFPEGGTLYFDSAQILREFEEVGLTPENHELVAALSNYHLTSRSGFKDFSPKSGRPLSQEEQYEEKQRAKQSAEKHLEDMLDKYKLLITGAF
jgi:hypothetical protein